MKTNADDYAKLYAKHLPGLRRDAQEICPKLTRHGACDISLCPDGCENFNLVLEVVEKKFKEAVEKNPSKKKINYKVRHDDVRREWNDRRGLKQRLQKNTFVRNEKQTDYGNRFKQNVDESILINVAFETLFSWLNDLYDDACDNSKIEWVEAKEFGGEPRYWDAVTSTFYKFGFDAERIYRYRVTDSNRRKLDKHLPSELQPKIMPPELHEKKQRQALLENELTKARTVCEVLFSCIQKSDEKLDSNATNASDEKFSEFPRESFGSEDINLNDPDTRKRIEKFLRKSKIDYKWSQTDGNWGLDYSQDDFDREDDKNSPESKVLDNPKALYDDFENAWKLTRGRVKNEHASTDEEGYVPPSNVGGDQF